MPLDPKLLPSPDTLRRRAKALAMVEAIVCAEWDDRYYSFNASWAVGEEMASMRNGSGDDWFVLFTPSGVGIRGLAHETSLAGDKALLAEVRKQVPAALESFLNEPAFGWDWMSYCYWRTVSDPSWQRVVHPNPALAKADDGSEEFLSLLLEPPSSYIEFASWYYELALSPLAVEAIYEHAEITPELVAAISPDASFEQVLGSAKEIGYPAPQGDA